MPAVNSLILPRWINIVSTSVKKSHKSIVSFKNKSYCNQSALFRLVRVS